MFDHWANNSLQQGDKNNVKEKNPLTFRHQVKYLRLFFLAILLI
jgi:hypothetical protein